jgi:hypothetical protein
MGMTWKRSVIRILFVVLVIGALAVATGANWAEGWLDDCLLAL